MIRRVHKKYGEPEMLYELMERMESDKRLRELCSIYETHFSETNGFKMTYCPHCNAKNLKTTATELIECIEGDIAGYSTKDYEEGGLDIE